MRKYADIIFLGLYFLATGLFTASSYYSGGISSALDTLGEGVFWLIVIFVVGMLCVVANEKSKTDK